MRKLGKATTAGFLQPPSHPKKMKRPHVRDADVWVRTLPRTLGCNCLRGKAGGPFAWPPGLPAKESQNTWFVTVPKNG